MYIRVKLDAPSLHEGPARVVAVGLAAPNPDTLRVGEADWQDDCTDSLVPGDRVQRGTVGVRRLPRE